MRIDDKRKETSRLDALKSTRPKTPEGKRRSAFNSTTHGAYARTLILPGERLPEFEELIKVHLETWKPVNLIEDLLVTEMASTLWRLRRQAPAEASLIDIQIQRMTCNELEFTSLNAHGAYGPAVAGLLGHSDALNQIARQGRRLLSLYQQLRQEILTNRQLFPPSAPEPPNLQPQSNLEPQNIPVETKLPEDQAPPNESMKNESAQTKPVETKLTASTAPHLSLPRETRIHNPNSLLYSALPPILQIGNVLSGTETESTIMNVKKAAAGGGTT